MDTWKGKKLYGADRRLTRAQLEECDRVPGAARCLATNLESLATGGRGAAAAFLRALEFPRESASKMAALLRQGMGLPAVTTEHIAAGTRRHRKDR